MQTEILIKLLDKYEELITGGYTVSSKRMARKEIFEFVQGEIEDSKEPVHPYG